MNESLTLESASKPNTEYAGFTTITTKEELQKAMFIFRSRHRKVDLKNILRRALGVPLVREVRYASMARIPEMYVEVARRLLSRFGLDATGALHCYGSLDAQGFQHLSVARLRKPYGASA